MQSLAAQSRTGNWELVKVNAILNRCFLPFCFGFNHSWLCMHLRHAPKLRISLTSYGSSLNELNMRSPRRLTCMWRHIVWAELLLGKVIHLIQPLSISSQGECKIACPNKNLQHVCDIVQKGGETDKAPFRAKILDSYAIVNTSSVASSCLNCPQS